MIKELLQEGFILKSKGYYKYAIEAFYKALEIDNSSTELIYEIADSYYLLGEEERAITYIEQILEINPSHIDSLKLLKKIFLDKKAFLEAEQSAKNIYCISNDINDLAEIFNLLNKQGRYDEIFEYKIPTKNGKILYELAFASFAKKDLQNAEELINEALQFEDNNQDYMLLKGKILLQSNNIEECLKLISQMKIDIDNPEILNFIGKIEQNQGNLKKAVRYFLEAIQLDSTNDEYFYNCASTYFKLDEIQLAKKYYNLAISKNPDNQNYHFALANLYYSGKHYKRALEELKYDFFEARLLRAIILYDTGYLALAKKELTLLNEQSPKNAIVLEYKKRIEEELKS